MLIINSIVIIIRLKLWKPLIIKIKIIKKIIIKITNNINNKPPCDRRSDVVEGEKKEEKNLQPRNLKVKIELLNNNFKLNDPYDA